MVKTVRSRVLHPCTWRCCYRAPHGDASAFEVKATDPEILSASLKHILGVHAVCGQWLLWISVNDARWRRKKKGMPVSKTGSAYSYKTSGTGTGRCLGASQMRVLGICNYCSNRSGHSHKLSEQSRLFVNLLPLLPLLSFWRVPEPHCFDGWKPSSNFCPKVIQSHIIAL